jgi:diphthamide biosynthesis methyltransferase
MSPQEKAKELIDKYEFVYIQYYTSMFEVKQCALIAVDEIIDLVKHIDVDSEDYWEEVKQEIINL